MMTAAGDRRVRSRIGGRAAAVAAVSVAAVAALVVTGCGRSADDGGRTPATTVGGGSATGEITVWAMGTEGEKLTTLAQGFMRANPGAKVKVTPIPWDGAHDKVATAIAARQTPDLAMIGTTWMGEFAKAGGLDPTPSGIVDPAAFFPGAWDTTRVSGTAYGVPWYVETRMLYVNSDVAAKAEITTPPKTWADLQAAVKAFRTKGGAQWGISLQPGGTGSWQTVLPFVWQNGGAVARDTTFTFDTPQATEALDYYKSFFTQRLSPTDLPTGSLEPDFVKGRIGAFVSGPWHIGILKDAGAAGKYQLWPMPGRQAATSFMGGSDLAVFKDAKNRDAAWKFVAYLSRPEVQVEWYRISADLPAVTASWKDPALTADPLLSAFGTQLGDAKAPPAIPTWEQVAAAFDTQVERLAKTGLTGAEAARAIQGQAAAIGFGT